MMQTGGKIRVPAGNVTFVVQHELWDGNIQDHSDQGVVILVNGEDGGKETTLLRFNCFDLERSYIYGPEKKNKLFRMDHTVDGNPIGWTVKTIRDSLATMLTEAGYPEIANGLDKEAVSDGLEEVESAARAKFMADRNTVKHNPGTDIFEAGNIKFGLEMRLLPGGDGGLAIHVLSDLAGNTGRVFTEETELLAFDCFWDGPHYHYGPRNKNHRIYWDRTLVEDPLGWVFDAFDGKNLGAMLERAGYPGIAADLDVNKVEEVLVNVKKRAREMQEEGMALTGHPGLPVDPTPNLVTG